MPFGIFFHFRAFTMSWSYGGAMRSTCVARTAVLACVVTALVLAGCGDFFVSEGTADHITLSTTGLLLRSAETKQITATSVTVGGTSTDVTNTAQWTSSDPAIATVSNTGLITAVGAGTAVITAAADGNEADARVVVSANTITGLSVTPNNPTLQIGGTQQLTAAAQAQQGTVPDISSITTWSSSSTSVATVNSSGLVTAQSSGTATITASVTTATATVSGTATVTVNQF